MSSALAVVLDFRTGRRLELGALADERVADRRAPSTLERVLDQHASVSASLRDRFDSPRRPGHKLEYAPKLSRRTRKIDTYGLGNIHNSVHQYKSKRGQWNAPMPMPANMRDLAVFLREFVAQFPNAHSRPVLKLGHRSDPLMWMDRKYKQTQGLLELANELGVRFEIHTISDLCAHEDYIDLIARGGHSVVMQLGYADHIERLLSPGAPNSTRRQAAIDKMRDLDIDVRTKPPTIPCPQLQLALFGEVIIKPEEETELC